MAENPIGKFGKEGMFWRGRRLELEDFREISNYLDKCLRQKDSSQILLNSTEDYELMLELVEAYKKLLKEGINPDIDFRLRSMPSIPPLPMLPKKPLFLLAGTMNSKGWERYRTWKDDIQKSRLSDKTALRNLKITDKEVLKFKQIEEYEEKLEVYQKLYDEISIQHAQLKEESQSVAAYNQKIKRKKALYYEMVQKLDGIVSRLRAKIAMPKKPKEPAPFPKRDGSHILWRGQRLSIKHFAEIREFLDGNLIERNYDSKDHWLLDYLELFRDIVLEFRTILQKEHATWVRSGGRPIQGEYYDVSRFRIMNHALERIEKKILNKTHNLTISVEKVPWELLPEGEGLGAAVNAYIRKTQTKYKARSFDGSRLEKLMTLTPVRCAVGREEFDGYMAFFFAGCDQAVLECGWEGNAIYVFPENKWASLSKFTKSELLETHTHELQRIVHDSDGRWLTRLRKEIQASKDLSSRSRKAR